MLSKFLFVAFAALATADVPVFNQDYYSGEFNSIAINQGGITEDDRACCPKTSPQCKVQSISTGGDHYSDFSHSRERDDSAQGSIVNWYGPIPGTSKKSLQMAVQPSGNPGEYVCAQYCPLQTDDMPKLEINEHALHLGKASVTQQGQGGVTKTVDHYRWKDRLIIIPMDQNDFYVDQSNASGPIPFYMSESLTPFGSKPIGRANTSYLLYQAGSPDQTKFNVVGIDNCTMSDNCNNNNNDNYRMLKNKLALLSRSGLSVAKEMAAARSSNRRNLRPRSRVTDSPQFPTDWSAHETAAMIINQGGKDDGNGNICCINGAPGQCQIQSQYISGQKYFDYSNNRTRLEDPINGYFVDDYKAGKSYEVYPSNNTCKSFCPLEEDELLPFGIDDDAKDKGSVVVDGKTLEHYQWHDVILKIIRMSTTDFYCDQSGSVAIPVSQTEHLTPFGGAEIGQQNNTWTNFVAGKQPAEKFNIANADECPEDPQCGNNVRQLHRLASRQFKTFMKYHQVISN